MVKNSGKFGLRFREIRYVSSCKFKYEGRKSERFYSTYYITLYIPVIKTPSLFTRRPKNRISIVLIRHNKEVINSFEMLFQDHGQFRDVLFQV